MRYILCTLSILFILSSCKKNVVDAADFTLEETAVKGKYTLKSVSGQTGVFTINGGDYSGFIGASDSVLDTTYTGPQVNLLSYHNDLLSVTFVADNETVTKNLALYPFKEFGHLIEQVSFSSPQELSAVSILFKRVFENADYELMDYEIGAQSVLGTGDCKIQIDSAILLEDTNLVYIDTICDSTKMIPYFDYSNTDEEQYEKYIGNQFTVQVVMTFRDNGQVKVLNSPTIHSVSEKDVQYFGSTFNADYSKGELKMEFEDTYKLKVKMN